MARLITGGTTRDKPGQLDFVPLDRRSRGQGKAGRDGTHPFKGCPSCPVVPLAAVGAVNAEISANKPERDQTAFPALLIARQIIAPRGVA